MKMVGNNVQLYPLKENRYKLVGLLIAHMRKIVREVHSTNLLGDQSCLLADKSVNPDHPLKVDDPVNSAIKDYLSGKISLPPVC